MNGPLFFFSALGVFNGLLLSTFLLVFNKTKSVSNQLLAWLILCLTIRIGKSVVMYFYPEVHMSVLQIGLSACLFIGPLLYYFLKSVKEKKQELPKYWRNTLLSFLILIIGVGLLRPYHLYPEFWNNYCVQIIYLVWASFILMSLLYLFPEIKNLFKDVHNCSAESIWILMIFFGNLIVASAFFAAFFGNSLAYYITGPLAFSFFLYLGAYGFYRNRFFKNDVKQKYVNKKIDDNKVQDLVLKLEGLMNNEKVFKASDLKLLNLAEELGITSHKLSQLLNDNLGISFKAYINKYRVEEACKILSLENEMSLEGVGYEVGFKSKSTFFTTFKKLKELTPQQYQQKIQAEIRN